jgi:hypothetical protein
VDAAEVLVVEEAAVALGGKGHTGVVGDGGRVGVEDDETAHDGFESFVSAVLFVGGLVDGNAPAAAAGVFAGGGDAAEGIGVGGMEVFAF